MAVSISSPFLAFLVNVRSISVILTDMSQNMNVPIIIRRNRRNNSIPL
jgi:hypothetical protein